MKNKILFPPTECILWFLATIHLSSLPDIEGEPHLDLLGLVTAVNECYKWIGEQAVEPLIKKKKHVYCMVLVCVDNPMHTFLFSVKKCVTN